MMLVHCEQPDTPILPGKLPGYNDKKSTRGSISSLHSSASSGSDLLRLHPSSYDVSPPLTPAISPSILLDKYPDAPGSLGSAVPHSSTASTGATHTQMQQQPAAVPQLHHHAAPTPASHLGRDVAFFHQGLNPFVAMDKRFDAEFDRNASASSSSSSSTSSSAMMAAAAAAAATAAASTGSNGSGQAHHRHGAYDYDAFPAGSNGKRAPQGQHKHTCKYPYCNWSFKRYEHLKRHMLVHTGERPHTCLFPGCGKSFSRSDNFHAHYRTHTKKAISSDRRNKLSVPSSAASDSSTSDASTNSYKKDLDNQHNATHQHQQQDFNFYSNETPFSNVPYAMPSNYEPSQPLYGDRNGVHGVNGVYMGMERSYYPPAASTPLPLSASTSMTSISPTSSSSPSSSLMITSPTSYGGYAPEYPAPSSSFHQPSPPYYSSFLYNAANGASAPQNGASTYMQPKQHAQQQPQDTLIKVHTCPVPQCLRRFKRLEHLKRHMRIHTLERPFACSFPNCNKTFSRSDNLSQHMKTHQRQEHRRKQQLQQHHHHQHSLPSTSPF